jgi:hypothetical protein
MNQTSVHTDSVPPTPSHDHNYQQFLTFVQERFLRHVTPTTKLFRTDAENLFAVYLNSLPYDDKQIHNCNTCRRFIDTYGGLVTVDEQGNTTSAIWGFDADKDDVLVYSTALQNLSAVVAKAKIVGVFLSTDLVWGQPKTGKWTHLAVVPPPHLLFRIRDTINTAEQAMAAKLQDFLTVRNALTEYNTNVLTTAVALLNTQILYQSEKCLGVAKWLLDLRNRMSPNTRGRSATNILWQAVASAPVGYCHPRSSMIGTLLTDLANGIPIQSVKRNFEVKMNPLRYQRPQAAPTDGNIAQAELIIKQLDTAGSLARRFATFDDVKDHLLWQPTVDTVVVPSTEAGSVFAHLRTEDKPKLMELPNTVITLEKFQRTVLQDARAIYFRIPTQKASFAALVTAVNKEAPPIIQWDYEDVRNPVSHYLYPQRSYASQWELSGFEAVVTGICYQPSMWGSDWETKQAHHGKSIHFLLENARDSQHGTSGAGLFPAVLKHELHSIRATIEAYSNAATIAGYKESSACGIRLTAGNMTPAVFRVVTSTTTALYTIDRWD